MASRLPKERVQRRRLFHSEALERGNLRGGGGAEFGVGECRTHLVRDGRILRGWRVTGADRLA